MRRLRAESYSEVLQKLRELSTAIADVAERVGEPGPSFGELAQGWLKRIGPRRVDGAANERKHVEHMAPLLELREGELTKAEIDVTFGALLKAGKLSAASINKLRSTGRLIIDDALGNEEWERANPFALVRRFQEPKPVYRVLKRKEALPVVEQFPEQHRALVMTVLLVGMRPGEAFALQKVDVDLGERAIIIRRSHARDVTKTKRERKAPIPRALVPILRRAMRESACELVFPKPGTIQRRSPNSRLSERMKTAMKRAGIVQGWRFRCRNGDLVVVERGQFRADEILRRPQIPRPGLGREREFAGVIQT